MIIETRRDFLKKSAFITGLLASGIPAWRGEAAAKTVPWYRRTTRWGQTNITEQDPPHYDIAWWRKHWKETRTQGVIVNAGGIVAYYPSKVPFHQPARFLAGRDLFGEISQAAREDGLVVFARMDSNRAHEDLYRIHPDWFAIDAARKPYKAGDLFITCVNGPYYEEHIPAILREIIERYRPEGFTDNSWSGLGRGSICYCENCRRRFHEKTGRDIPREKDWNEQVYRDWIVWNYARRLEIWDSNNRVTQSAGGPDCIWVGMNGGSISGQCQSFRDYKEICRRAEIIMLDDQARADASGFQHNGEIGKLIHGMLGWDKLIPESMAMYQAGRPTFRLASKPEPEARMWMLDGIAGGLQPWWHHIGAYHEDRRMYHTAEPVYRWHETHEEFLINRRPIATVGVLWSQQNTDFFGRDDPDLLVELPFRGMTQALVRVRIPYLPIHADQLEREASHLSVLVLPNLAAMPDSQIESIKRFVQAGGGLVATGESSLFNEWGDARADFALGNLYGAHATGPRKRSVAETAHTYLRLVPERRALVNDPQIGAELPIAGERHAVLRGFDETDILPFGGTLGALRVDDTAQVLMTFIPPFPIYPPETAWMREPKTDVPGLILNTVPGGGRVAFLPADLDRRFGRDNLPDHGTLLANVVRWAAKGRIPLQIDGVGMLDCHLYQQPGRVILHLVNLTSAGTWRQPVDELIPIGPIEARLELPPGIHGKHVRSLVAEKTVPAATKAGWIHFQIKSILDHEVVVIQ